MEPHQVSGPSPGESMEKLLVKRLVLLFAPHRKENVATDEFVDDFGIRGQALEFDASILAVDLHFFDLVDEITTTPMIISVLQPNHFIHTSFPQRQ